MKISHLAVQKFIGYFAIIFGIISSMASSLVLFTEEGKSVAGQIVYFVLWANFLLSLLYILTGVMILRRMKLSIPFSFFIAATSLVILLGLISHILRGNAYEIRTLMAMSLRTFFWILISITNYRILRLN